MKKVRLNLIFAAVFTAIALVACSQEEEIIESGAAATGKAIRVSTNDEGTTRMGYTTSNLSDFGFFVNTPGKPEHTYNNVRMIKGSNGEWNPEGNLMMEWWNAMVPVDIVAYAPYQSNKPYTTSSKVSVSVKADQSSEENLIASDFIAMKWKGFLPWKDEKSGKVPVTFKHLMSRFKLKISYTEEMGTEDGGSPVTNLRLGGSVRLNGICDLSQLPLVVTPVSSENLEIYPFQAEYDKVQRFVAYEAMLIPQRVVILLKMKIVGPYSRDNTYILDMDMESGRAYTIHLLVKKDSIVQIIENA